MMRINLFALTSFVLIAAATVGCSFHIGESTAGDSGKVHFKYTGPGCLLGCGVDQGVLQGAGVTVSITGADRALGPGARLAGPSIGTISKQHTECTDAGECTLYVDLDTTQAGDGTLEIAGRDGKRIDSTTIHVKAAGRIEVSVSVAQPVNGIYEVKKGTPVKIGSKVFARDGEELRFERHGVSHEYGDKSLIGPDDSVIFGATDVEDMVAGNKAGETTVKVTAPGAVNLVRFRVVP